MNSLNVAWTGGYDSTYMMIDFLRNGYKVKPFYMINLVGRLNESFEIDMMEKMFDILKKGEYGNNLENIEWLDNDNKIYDFGANNYNSKTLSRHMKILAHRWGGDRSQYKALNDYLDNVLKEPMLIGIHNEEIYFNIFDILGEIVPDWENPWMKYSPMDKYNDSLKNPRLTSKLVYCGKFPDRRKNHPVFKNFKIPSHHLGLFMKLLDYRKPTDEFFENFGTIDCKIEVSEWMRFPIIHKSKHLYILEMYEDYHDLFLHCITCRTLDENGRPCGKCLDCQYWDQYKLENSNVLRYAKKLREYCNDNNLTENDYSRFVSTNFTRGGRHNIEYYRKKLNLE